MSANLWANSMLPIKASHVMMNPARQMMIVVIGSPGCRVLAHDPTHR
jgi:hypothetical protein